MMDRIEPAGFFDCMATRKIKNFVNIFFAINSYNFLKFCGNRGVKKYFHQECCQASEVEFVINHGKLVLYKRSSLFSLFLNGSLFNC